MSNGVQQFLTEHARGISIIEGLVRNVYTVLHDENAGAPTVGTSDWQAVVLEAGQIKRVGACLRTAGGGACTVQFRVNTVVVATVTIAAGQTQATTSVVSPREVLEGNLLDLNVTVSSGVALTGEFGVM